MRKLYRYRESFRRMGTLERVFLATDEEIEMLIGKELYFGEVLGKHSEIIGVLDCGTLSMISEDQAFIDKALEIGLIPIGRSPVDVFKNQPDDED